MRPLKAVWSFFIGHARDAAWLALAAIFLAISWAMTIQTSQVRHPESSSTTKQEFRIFHLPAAAAPSPQCDKGCKLDTIDVLYKMKADHVAFLTFYFRQIPQSLSDEVHIFLNNFSSDNCSYKIDYKTSLTPEVKTLPVNADADGKSIFFAIQPKEKITQPYDIKIDCTVRATARQYSFTKFQYDFVYDTADKSGSGRGQTESTGAGSAAPATNPGEPPKPIANPPKAAEPRKTDFSELYIKTDLTDVDGENPSYFGGARSERKSGTAMLLVPGTRMTVDWTDLAQEGEKERRLVWIGIFAAASVAAFVEALRPHIDRLKKKRNAKAEFA